MFTISAQKNSWNQIKIQNVIIFKKTREINLCFLDMCSVYITYFSKLRLNSTSMAKIARYSVTSLLTILFNKCRMGGCVIFARGLVPWLRVNDSFLVILSSSFWMSPKTKGMTSEYAFSIPSPSWKNNKMLHQKSSIVQILDLLYDFFYVLSKMRVKINSVIVHRGRPVTHFLRFFYPSLLPCP